LIQGGGTREIFLSNFVRQYQGIERGGGRAILDLYEGMPHVFQTVLAGTPESDAAYAKAASFWSAELAK
jgi:monoterpene epsilon-lactone hydrolase